jgi:uncharacterized Zn-finger protein
MIYQFKCPLCGHYKEVVRHHSECQVEEYCNVCSDTTGAVMVMERVYSTPMINISSVVMGYNPALGCEIRSKMDIRDAQRRIKEETGHDVVEIGNEKLRCEPKLKEYDFPRGVFDEAIKD